MVLIFGVVAHALDLMVPEAIRKKLEPIGSYYLNWIPSGYELIITNSNYSTQYTSIPAYLLDPASAFSESLVLRLPHTQAGLWEGRAKSVGTRLQRHRVRL